MPCSASARPGGPNLPPRLDMRHGCSLPTGDGKRSQSGRTPQTAWRGREGVTKNGLRPALVPPPCRGRCPSPALGASCAPKGGGAEGCEAARGEGRRRQTATSSNSVTAGLPGASQSLRRCGQRIAAAQVVVARVIDRRAADRMRALLQPQARHQIVERKGAESRPQVAVEQLLARHRVHRGSGERASGRRRGSGSRAPAGRPAWAVQCAGSQVVSMPVAEPLIEAT